VSDDGVEILLVEDNPDDVHLTLHAFGKHGPASRIEVARDGVEALEFVFCTGAHARRRPDGGPRLILLDLKLPRVDGFDVLRRLKADPRTRVIPVVVLTTSREDRDVVESYQLGANSYIMKPVNFEEFTEAVRQIGLYWMVLNQLPVPRG
jgi:CheY-like chemotaxis protein